MCLTSLYLLPRALLQRLIEAIFIITYSRKSAYRISRFPYRVDNENLLWLLSVGYYWYLIKKYFTIHLIYHNKQSIAEISITVIAEKKYKDTNVMPSLLFLLSVSCSLDKFHYLQFITITSITIYKNHSQQSRIKRQRSCYLQVVYYTVDIYTGFVCFSTKKSKHLFLKVS